VKLATWNVNSVRIREPHVCRWLQRVEPDVLLLQEIKCEEKQFPAAAFKALGYDSVIAGQKSYNGVAILSRIPLDVHHVMLPGLPAEDAQARYLEVVAAGVTIGNLYLPNGNSGGEAGFAYKLAWMTAPSAFSTPTHPSCWPATTTSPRRTWITPRGRCRRMTR
jgi:exodeoxyribonuclease-3